VRTILECAAAAIVLTAVIGWPLGIAWCKGYVAGREEMKDEALARGVARYHPETGDWEWTVDPTSPASPR
jgi:hypothetical protein